MQIGLCQTCHHPKPRRLQQQRGTELLRCWQCREQDQRPGICSKCGLEKCLVIVNPALCRQCISGYRYQDTSTWKKCSGCRRPRPVAVRTVDGPICHTCRYRIQHGIPLGTATLRPRKSTGKWRAVRPKKALPIINLDTWCVDCQASHPNVLLYGDKQRRCPTHGLAYLKAKRVTPAQPATG